jgi:cytidylate kinase
VSRLVVAIDGPAGAGKSTVTRRVAEALGYTVLDTGALYRAVAYGAREAGVDWADDVSVVKVAEELAQSGRIRFENDAAGKTHLWLGETDVTSAIRTPEMGQGASKVSAVPGVRRALFAMQRELGRQGGVVAEGRDIGTVVFPDARAKFFLTASVDVRSKRRYDEHMARGEQVDIEQIRRDVVERDERDTQRPVAPLRQAPDAELIDSSDLGIDEVVELIVRRVREIEREAGS